MQIDQLWATIAVETCICRGFNHFFLAPGSRCTPLTLAVANHPQAIVHQHFDERGLAFAALGYGRASRRPGVFICTSGTAVANALPAVVEAATDCVPMLLMTADRPPELRDVGANQAIDQVRIFGDYARWFVDMPCPTDRIESGFVRSQVEYGLNEAAAGPAHLNWMFREPFGASDQQPPLPRAARSTVATQEVLSSSKIECGKTIIAVGSCRAEEAQSARQLATIWQVPIVSDITSGLRCGSPELPSQFDLPLPDTILHIGGRMVSKNWMRYVGALEQSRVLRISHQRNRIDPTHHGVEQLVMPLDRLHDHVTLLRPADLDVEAFFQAWTAAQRAREAAIDRVLDDQAMAKAVSEPAIAHHLARLLPTDGGLFLGNSTPIRDMDWFGTWDAGKVVQVAANRGASGIDGLIATAAGFSLGLNKPTTLLLGDLAALHDLNSLALLKQIHQPFVVVVMNNHGGGIFDMLPVASQTRHFEQYFATPHAFSFSQAAQMFGLDYRCPSDMEQFATEYSTALRRSQPTILELITDRTYNATVRAKINEEIS